MNRLDISPKRRELGGVSRCRDEFTEPASEKIMSLSSVRGPGLLKGDTSTRTRFPFGAIMETRVREGALQRGARGAAGREETLGKCTEKQPHVSLNGCRKRTDLRREREKGGKCKGCCWCSTEIPAKDEGADHTGGGDVKTKTRAKSLRNGGAERRARWKLSSQRLGPGGDCGRASFTRARGYLGTRTLEGLDVVTTGPCHTQDAQVKARQSAAHTHLRAAADGGALLLPTLRLALHTGADGAVHGGPHLSILGREHRTCHQRGPRELIQQAGMPLSRVTDAVTGLHYSEVPACT